MAIHERPLGTNPPSSQNQHGTEKCNFTATDKSGSYCNNYVTDRLVTYMGVAVQVYFYLTQPELDGGKRR